MKVNDNARWCLALVAAILLFYWKLFFPSQFTLLDGAEAVGQGYSWLHFWMRSVRAGTLPIWDPYALSGYSFPGEMQTGAFYPLYLFLLLLPLGPDGLLSSMQYNLIILSAHVLAALFMFALAREFKLSYFAAFISGLCFSVGSFTGSVGWPHMLESSIWLPLIFLYLLRALKSSDLRWQIVYCLVSGCCLGVSLLAGGLHIAMAQTITVVAATVFYAFSRDGSRMLEERLRVAWWPCTRIAALLLTTAFCTAAVQLLPSHVYADRSIRFVGSYALPSSKMIPYVDVARHAISPAGVLSVLFPVFDGIGQGEIWTPYIGALPFLFACIGIGKCWSQMWVRFLAGLSVGALLYAMAGVSALHGVFYALVPWLWIAREATRFIYLAGFALALLAGFGADAFCFRASGEFFWNALRGVLAKVLTGCCIVLCSAPILVKFTTSWTFFSILMIFASCGLLFFAMGKERISRGWSFLVIALAFFDLNSISWIATSKIDADRANRNELTTLTSAEGVVHFLRSRPGIFRISVFRDPAPNLGDAFGVQSTSGAGVTFEKSFDAVRGNLELLNSRYFIKPKSATDPDPVYQDEFWKVYENPRAFPRCWLVHDSKFEPDENKMFRAVRQNDVDLHKTALLSRPLPSSINAAVEPSAETVSIRSYTADHITTSVHTKNAALLVFSEIFYPGWHATVNGREETLYRANGAFRSVLVPAGDSTVELSYRPLPVYLGLLLSTTALVITLLSLLWAWQKGSYSRREQNRLLQSA